MSDSNNRTPTLYILCDGRKVTLRTEERHGEQPECTCATDFCSIDSEQRARQVTLHQGLAP